MAAGRSVPDEPITVTLSRNGWIRSRQGHGLDATQFGWKAGDAPRAILETRTVNGIVVLDTQGRAYTLRGADVPGGRGDGVQGRVHVGHLGRCEVGQLLCLGREQLGFAGRPGSGALAQIVGRLLG